MAVASNLDMDNNVIKVICQEMITMGFEGMGAEGNRKLL